VERIHISIVEWTDVSERCAVCCGDSIGALFRGVSEDSPDASPVVRENSAVYQALKDGRVEEARELLEKLQLEEEGAVVQEAVNGENEGAATVLHAAAAHGDEEVRGGSCLGDQD
jgi:hypothetical protein